MTVDLQDTSGATVTGALSPYDLQYRTIVTIPDLSATPSAPDHLTWAVAFDRQTGSHYLRGTRVTDYVDIR